MKTLTYNIKTDDVGKCLSEIQEAVNDAKGKLDNLVKQIGLTDLPDFSTVELNEESKYKLYRGLAAIPSMALSSFATFYAVRGFMLVTLIVRTVGDTISSVARILGGALGGLVVGGITFILSDMIVSAITGAIERRQMEDAITVLKQLVQEVCVPLQKATNIIGGIIQNINEGLYKINDSALLVRTGKNENNKEIWSVIVISSAPQNRLESP